MNRLFCVLFWKLLFVLSVNCNLETTRQTANGPVEGIVEESLLGQKYYSFRGIPFAEPPITGIDPYTGQQVDRRFKSPEPLKRNWTEALQVHKFNHSCITATDIQSFKEKNTSEDCLFLNIYVPIGGLKRKTVLIFIHGGGFSVGNARYRPDFLLSKDNILVTIQYRLGIFGFLNLGLDDYSGNMGLKDQQLAIKWIYENIENFSGKKDEILLFGQSAGGSSVHFHMLNEESRKYFSRAFIMSLSAFSPLALSEVTNDKHIQINDKKSLIEYLKVANSSILTKLNPYTGGINFAWKPTIEPLRTVGAFMTATPNEIYKLNKAPSMDTLFSFNSNEFFFFAPDFHLINYTHPLLTENWDNIQLPYEGFTKNAYPNEFKEAVEILRKSYFSNATDEMMNEHKNIDLMSDMEFCDSIIKAAVLQTKSNNNNQNSETGQKSTFLYRFAVSSDLNFERYYMHITYDGATHSDDLGYIFRLHSLDKFQRYDEHLKSKDTIYMAIMHLVNMITNFARTGNPSVEGDTPFKSCKSENEIYCQEISNDTSSIVITNIKEQLHYDAWRKVEEIYDKNIREFLTQTEDYELKINYTVLFYCLLGLFTIIVIIVILISIGRILLSILFKSKIESGPNA